MRSAPIIAVLGLYVAGCQCRPDPSVPDTDVPTPHTGPTDTAPLDTGPEPRCLLPETEPNNAVGEEDMLPLEIGACGEFRVPGDADAWRFSTTSDVWLGVFVDARENGSFADPTVVLSADDGFALLKSDGTETADVHLIFPSPPRDYTLRILEQNGQGDTGRRFFYDVLASVQKAPVEWTQVELEPNDDRTTATEAFDGNVFFGTIDADGDEDFYRIDVPVDRHTITVQVTGFDVGSPLDTVIYLQSEDGSSPGCGAGNASCVFSRGPIGFERDPWLEFSSLGDETLYLRVAQEGDLAGQTSAHWYALDVRVEGVP